MSSASGSGNRVFTKTIVQVVVGRGQWEKPVTGVYHPVDEGLDFGEGLVFGLGDEPTMAKVPAQHTSR